MRKRLGHVIMGELNHGNLVPGDVPPNKMAHITLTQEEMDLLGQDLATQLDLSDNPGAMAANEIYLGLKEQVDNRGMAK